jgi:hypothetical protein
MEPFGPADVGCDGRVEPLTPIREQHPNQHPPADGATLVLRNEFASVSVRLCDPGGRPRLLIEDLRTQQTVELDPTELESLAWARHEDLFPLLDPSLTRWANRGD